MSQEQPKADELIERQVRIKPYQKLYLYYKILSKTSPLAYDDVCKAQILDLSASGAKLCGCIPSLRLIKLLGTEKLCFGCYIPLPDKDIKILARLRWCDSSPKESRNCVAMGIEFIKISSEDQKLLNNYIVKAQIEKSKITRK